MTAASDDDPTPPGAWAPRSPGSPPALGILVTQRTPIPGRAQRQRFEGGAVLVELAEQRAELDRHLVQAVLNRGESAQQIDISPAHRLTDGIRDRGALT
ncbi:MAG: hypothetical protein ACRDRX_17085 [Pseudonocardiaceae bacterium]